MAGIVANLFARCLTCAVYSIDQDAETFINGAQPDRIMKRSVTVVQDNDKSLTPPIPLNQPISVHGAATRNPPCLDPARNSF
jgi:hypothetical protein